jgi:hypothetical protein
MEEPRDGTDQKNQYKGYGDDVEGSMEVRVERGEFGGNRHCGCSVGKVVVLVVLKGWGRVVRGCVSD